MISPKESLREFHFSFPNSVRGGFLRAKVAGTSPRVFLGTVSATSGSPLASADPFLFLPGTSDEPLSTWTRCFLAARLEVGVWTVDLGCSGILGVSTSSTTWSCCSLVLTGKTSVPICCCLLEGSFGVSFGISTSSIASSRGSSRPGSSSGGVFPGFDFAFAVAFSFPFPRPFPFPFVPLPLPLPFPFRFPSSPPSPASSSARSPSWSRRDTWRRTIRKGNLIPDEIAYVPVPSG